MYRLEPGRGWLAALFAASALLVAPAAPADETHEHDKMEAMEQVEGASAIEGRIRAPCCWTQTIDIHGSPVSNELRREIRSRLRAGEAGETIEADIVKRYGEKILAVPPGNPLKDVGVLLSLGFGAAGIGAGFMLLRWRRRSQAARAEELDKESKRPKRGSKRDRYDDEIDAELEKL